MICPQSARVSGLYHQRGFPLSSKTITQGRLSAGFEKVTTKSPGGAGRSDSKRQDGKSAGRATCPCLTATGPGSSPPSPAPPQEARISAPRTAASANRQGSRRFIDGRRKGKTLQGDASGTSARPPRGHCFATG